MGSVPMQHDALIVLLIRRHLAREDHMSPEIKSIGWKNDV